MTFNGVRLHSSVLGIALAAVAPQLYAATTVFGAHGLTLTVEAGGAYQISVPSLNWLFSGNVGYPLSNVQPRGDADPTS